MDKHPDIISVVEHWGFEDDDYYWYEIQFYKWVSLDIKMENGRRLFLSYIHPSNLKAPFYLNLIGKSSFEILHFSGKKTHHEVGIPIDFVEKNIGIQLSSVDDVIGNYDLIRCFTDSLTKLADIDDIDVRNRIISDIEHSYFYSYWWNKYIQPIITDEDKLYILNITYDEVPNAKRFEKFTQIAVNRERRYFHYKTGVFEGNQLTNVTVPNGVTAIGPVEFQSNKLSSVTIPNSVISIGPGAFQDNQLTSITIPDSVISIGPGAFQNNQLTSVTIPDSVTSIGPGAFWDNQLTSVAIGNGVTSIGEYAFWNNQLTSVIIPDNVASIGEYAFSDNHMTSVTIGSGVTIIEGMTFYNNQLASVTIPDSVTYIGFEAFKNNLLTSVTIPDGVTRIRYGAFGNNPLTSITIGANVDMEAVSNFGRRSDWIKDRSSYYSFPAFYNGNGKKAGLYTYNGKRWSCSTKYMVNH
jgi:hypothetical protein